MDVVEKIEATGSAGSDRGSRAAQFWAWTTLVLAGLGVVGSLFLSLGLGLRACPLCFYQRTFVMAVFAVLAVGLFTDQGRAGFLCLLALPMAVGGLGVAAFHEYLVLAGKLECPDGLFGLGTAPAQSLAVFVLLGAVTGFGACAKWCGTVAYRPGAVLGAVVLGLLLAWSSVVSSPPMPVRTTPYDAEKEPLNICRRPYLPT